MHGLHYNHTRYGFTQQITMADCPAGMLALQGSGRRLQLAPGCGRSSYLLELSGPLCAFVSEQWQKSLPCYSYGTSTQTRIRGGSLRLAAWQEVPGNSRGMAPSSAVAADGVFSITVLPQALRHLSQNPASERVRGPPQHNRPLLKSDPSRPARIACW